MKCLSVKSIKDFERHLLKRKLLEGTQHCRAGLHIPVWGHQSSQKRVSTET
jgi:hypothetical protein